MSTSDYSNMIKSPAVVDSLMLGGTLVVRDSLFKGKQHWKKAGVLAASQFVYDMYLRQKAEPALQALTGENYFSSLLANSLGLGVITLATKKVGLISKESDPVEEGGIAITIKANKGVAGEFLDGSIEALELLIEQRILKSATGMVMPSMVPANQPVAATN
jgi:hypothetical protein